MNEDDILQITNSIAENEEVVLSNEQWKEIVQYWENKNQETVNQLNNLKSKVLIKMTEILKDLQND